MSAMQDEQAVWTYQKAKKEENPRALITPVKSKLAFKSKNEQVSHIKNKLRHIEALDASINLN